MSMSISANTPFTTSQPGVQPAFLTADDARIWLDAQPLASTVQMQSLLQRQLGLINRHPVPASERFAILETLRTQIYRTQHECQARFARRPIPLAPPEHAAFDASQATWHALADGYIRCLESLLSGESAVQDKAAIIVERILATLVNVQTDIYRSGSMPPPTHWHQLHQCIDVAEHFGIIDEKIKDRLHDADTHVSIGGIYAEAFLLHNASLNELGQRQMTWILRWARHWGSRVKLHQDTSVAQGPAVPFYVALDSSEPACRTQPLQGRIRVLDTSELRRSLKKRLTGLARGQQPGELQLGDDCVQPATGQLLETVYQRWCKNNMPRRHERRPGSGNSQLHCGFEEAHRAFLGDRPFQPPGVVDMSRLRQEREEIATLVQPLETSKPQQAAAGGESWRIIDESPGGMRIARIEGKSRIAVGMLLSLQVPGTSHPMLACVRWCFLNAEGKPEMGVQIIPGQAEACTVGGKPNGAKNTMWERALLLPSVPALKEVSSLILPNGWFEAGRILELRNGAAHNIRLGQPLERGRDFDRVTFSETA